MRILSLAPSNTEILYALGLGDQIIGVTAYCDYPDEAKKKPKVGSWITTSPEKIRQLSPDFIFTSYFLPPILENWSGPGKVVHVAPTTLAEVYKSILLIGSTTNTIKQAKKIVQTMQTEFEQLRLFSSQFSVVSSRQTVNQLSVLQTDKLKTGKPASGNRKLRTDNRRPRIYMEEWMSPPMASGNWVPELVEIAGGIPVIAKKGKASHDFQFNTLLQSDPDIMIFHWCGADFSRALREKKRAIKPIRQANKHVLSQSDKQMIRKRVGWSKLHAVKTDQLFVIDDSLLNRPGPRLVKGARSIQEILLDIAN